MTIDDAPAWTPVPGGLWRALRQTVETYAGASFTVRGDPVPKKRRVGQGRAAFTPERTRLAEKRVWDAFRAALPDWEPEPDRTYGVLVEFHTKSGSKVDIDNTTKLIMDALNTTLKRAGFWQDDIQVGDMWSHLERGRREPGVEVLLFTVEPNGTPLSKLCECGTRYRSQDRMCELCNRRRTVVNQLLAGGEDGAAAAAQLDRHRRAAFSYITTRMIGTNAAPSIADIARHLGVTPDRASNVIATLISDGNLARENRRLKILKPLGAPK